MTLCYIFIDGKEIAVPAYLWMRNDGHSDTKGSVSFQAWEDDIDILTSIMD